MSSRATERTPRAAAAAAQKKVSLSSVACDMRPRDVRVAQPKLTFEEWLAKVDVEGRGVPKVGLLLRTLHVNCWGLALHFWSGVGRVYGRTPIVVERAQRYRL